MPITTNNIRFYLSNSSATSGAASAGVIATSLGKWMSRTEIPNAQLNNLFDDVSGDEDAASDIEYRCFFVANNHASLTLQNAVIWVSGQVSGGASGDIGLDATSATPSGHGGVYPQASSVADEGTAPASVSFSQPLTKATGLSIGNLSAGYVKAVWVRRSALNNGPKDNDGMTISVAGDTSE